MFFHLLHRHLRPSGVFGHIWFQYELLRVFNRLSYRDLVRAMVFAFTGSFSGRYFKLFLDIFLEIFISTPHMLLVHGFPLGLVAEDILKLSDEGVGDGHGLAGIDEIDHRWLLGAHQTGTEADSQVVGCHFAALLVSQDVFLEELEQKGQGYEVEIR